MQTDIQIFDAMDECSEEALRRMLSHVSAQRREQALRYRHPMGRFCCLKSWLLLCELLERNGYPCSLADEWHYNEHGKPFLGSADGSGQASADVPYFSISHCKEGIAVALSDRPVGIDIEHIRRADDALIERTMNSTEQNRLSAALREGMEARNRLFTRLWTQKEAVLKALGTGIESFEGLQELFSPDRHGGTMRLQTIEKENYIYSIAEI